MLTAKPNRSGYVIKVAGNKPKRKPKNLALSQAVKNKPATRLFRGWRHADKD